jgi:hypothetical protein
MLFVFFCGDGKLTCFYSQMDILLHRLMIVVMGLVYLTEMQTEVG